MAILSDEILKLVRSVSRGNHMALNLQYMRKFPCMQLNSPLSILK